MQNTTLDSGKKMLVKLLKITKANRSSLLFIVWYYSQPTEMYIKRKHTVKTDPV